MVNLYLRSVHFSPRNGIMSLSELKMLATPTQVVTKSNFVRLFRLFRFVLTLLQSISWPQVDGMFAAGGFSVGAVTLAR
jgi:hypothetical protein